MSNNSYEQPQTTSPSIQTCPPTPSARSGPGFHLDPLLPDLPQIVEFGTPITYPVSVFSRNTYALPNGDSQNAAAATWESGGQMPVTIPHNPLSGGSYAFLPSPVHATGRLNGGGRFLTAGSKARGVKRSISSFCARGSPGPRLFIVPPGFMPLLQGCGPFPPAGSTLFEVLPRWHVGSGLSHHDALALARSTSQRMDGRVRACRDSSVAPAIRTVADGPLLKLGNLISGMI
ncbi:hypothetical protein BGW80DRAFT_1247057 [Lactifluus volemus]|nr:hypothetical protein BGW80DRAFT_1247057 [Lactifluus volemus]